MSQELALGLDSPGVQKPDRQVWSKEGESRVSAQAAGVGPGEGGRGTYHHLAAFDQ